MEVKSIADRTDTRSAGLRAHLHGMWSAVADSWSENAAYVDARGAHVTEEMLDVVALRPGDDVLELACGPGSVGLAAAARVSPGGSVVMSDVAAEMTAIAAARAASLGLTNVSTRELDLEQIEQPDRSYDVVLCREGLMLVPDPPSQPARSIAFFDPADGSRRGVGASRAEPLARPRLRRGQRPDRPAGASAWDSRPVLARRRPTLAGLLSTPDWPSSAAESVATPLRASVRRVVDENVRPRGAAGKDGRIAARRRRTGPSGPPPGRRRPIRDAPRPGVPRHHPAGLGAPPVTPADPSGRARRAITHSCDATATRRRRTGMHAMTLARPLTTTSETPPTFAGAAERHLDDVFGYLLYLTRDRALADDLSGATFEKALRQWSRFDPRRGTARTWLLESPVRRRSTGFERTRGAGGASKRPRSPSCTRPISWRGSRRRCKRRSQRSAPASARCSHSGS